MRQMPCAVLRLFLFLTFCLPCLASYAQTGFGAQDLLRERTTQYWWERKLRVRPMAGLSLIGAQWRGIGTVMFDWVRFPVAAELAGAYRLGPLGSYESDVDEWYDLVRLITYARYEERGVYARVGPIQDMRLGIGHVVNFYSTTAAWDTRTVGAEFNLSRGPVSVGGFTGDVRLNNVSGGRITIRAPRDTRLGLNYVTHRHGDVSAWSTDLHIDLFDRGGIAFAPFISYAWYTGHGDGLAFGGDIHAEEFIDLLSFNLRIGAFYNSRQFIPGSVSYTHLTLPTKRIV